MKLCTILMFTLINSGLVFSCTPMLGGQHKAKVVLEVISNYQEKGKELNMKNETRLDEKSHNVPVPKVEKTVIDTEKELISTKHINK